MNYTRTSRWADMPDELKDAFQLAIQLKIHDAYASPDDAVEAIQTAAEATGRDTGELFAEIEKVWSMITSDFRLDVILAGVETDPVPEVGPDALRRSANFCMALRIWHRLQEASGNAPFFLGRKKLAELCDTNERTAQRWIHHARRYAILQLAREAIPHKRAAEYTMPSACIVHAAPPNSAIGPRSTNGTVSAIGTRSTNGTVSAGSTNSWGDTKPQTRATPTCPRRTKTMSLDDWKRKLAAINGPF